MTAKGKVAVITGGVSGLGKHLADTLHSQGAILVLADVNEKVGETVAAEYNATRPNSAFFVRTDVTKWEDQVSLFRFIINQPHTPRIDYVFANAGLFETPFLPPMTSTSLDGVDWSEPPMKGFEVNAKGVMYTSQLAAQIMRTQSLVDGFRGKIIVTASVAAFAAIGCMPLYSASKHSLVGFIRGFAPQVALHNITINGVGPNVTRSSLAAPEIFDAVQGLGQLTPNDIVTEAFLSFLGDSKENGLIKEVSMNDIAAPVVPEPLNPEVSKNVAMLYQVAQEGYEKASTALHPTVQG
ncbi:NAD(P)-binding protein [Clavulina sp. PMI_390]|nr:NAD(P)-binding protein [Clavulina sp. PMI_390]